MIHPNNTTTNAEIKKAQSSFTMFLPIIFINIAFVKPSKVVWKRYIVYEADDTINIYFIIHSLTLVTILDIANTAPTPNNGNIIDILTL